VKRAAAEKARRWIPRVRADKLDRNQPLYTIRRIIVPEWTGPQLLRDMRRDF